MAIILGNLIQATGSGGHGKGRSLGPPKTLGEPMTSTARLLPNEVTCDPCCLADELTPPWQIGQRAGGMVALAKTASLFVPRTSCWVAGVIAPKEIGCLTVKITSDSAPKGAM